MNDYLKNIKMDLDLERIIVAMEIGTTANFIIKITKINKPMIINQGSRGALALAFEEIAQMSKRNREIRIQNANI